MQYRRAPQTRSAVTLHVLLLALTFPVGLPRANGGARCISVRLVDLPSEVRDGRSVDQNRQADGWCVSASSHAIGLLYFVLVTEVIVVSTADTGLRTVLSSLVVAPSIVLLLLLPACRWLLDSLPVRHTLTPPPLHCEHGDQVNPRTSAKWFCE